MSKDAPTVARMRELAAQYPRYGGDRFYRVFLERQGHRMSADGAYRCGAVDGRKCLVNAYVAV